MFSEKEFINGCIDFLSCYNYSTDEEIKKDIKMFINIYLSSNINNLKPGLSEKIFIEFINQDNSLQLGELAITDSI
jgi:hypothetical protein